MTAESTIEIGQEIFQSERTSVLRGEWNNRKVIIKKIQKKSLNSRSLAAFRREFELAKTIESPFVAKPLHFADVEGCPAQIFEDHDAESLRAVLSSRALTLREALKIALAAARGLADLHKANLIHKDICPSNIVVNLQADYTAIIDFGIATKLSREEQTALQQMEVEGTTNYLSPEQTGRMNRALDYRSDFFSFGATLYEMLTRTLAFDGRDVAEVIHKILAFQPVSIRELRPDVPVILESIVLKLLEKDPELRYQSATGLAHDLKTCLDLLTEDGQIPAFEMLTRDDNHAFSIPDRLYGREAPVKSLLASFAKAAAGGNALAVVAGPSGIGKSAVVAELRKPLSATKGRFVTGKFAQYRRNTPLSALQDALNALVLAVLKLPQHDLDLIKARLSKALGEEAQALKEVIPSLEDLLGQLAPVQQLEAEQTRARLFHLMKGFVRAMASQAEPLILFIDDMQWADLATTDLLEALSLDTSIVGFFLITAYRDNEVDSTHPFLLSLNRLQSQGKVVETLTLGPIGVEDTTRILGDITKADLARCQPLAQLVHARTAGNPFFIKAFITHLYRLGLLDYRHEASQWDWDVQAIEAQKATDNVVDLLLENLSTLSEGTRRALMLAACVSDVFSHKTLMILLGQKADSVARDLWPALKENYLVPLGQDYRLLEDLGGIQPDDDLLSRAQYRFAHDRVQQAAHEMLPEAERAETHWRMSRLLLQALTQAEAKERVFEIADHLNLGLSQMSTEEDRLQVLEFNAEAGNQALTASAFESAVHYSSHARRQVRAKDWTTRPEVVEKIFSGLARALNMNGRFEETKQVVKELIDHIPDLISKSLAYEMLGAMYEGKALFKECIEACLAGLKILGVNMSIKTSKLKAMNEMALMALLINEKFLTWYETKGTTTDRRWKAIISIATRSLPSCYVANQDLWAFMIMRLFRLAYKNKIYIDEPSFGAALALCTLSMKKSLFLSARAAQRIKTVANALHERKRNTPFEALFLLMAGHYTDILDGTFDRCIGTMEQAYLKSMDLGDVGNAGSAVVCMHVNGLVGGRHMTELVQSLDQYEPFFDKRPDHWAMSLFMAIRQTFRAWSGQTTNPAELSDDRYAEVDVRRVALTASAGSASLYKTLRSLTDFALGRHFDAVKVAHKNLIDLALPACPAGILHYSVLAISSIRLLKEKRRPLPKPILLGLIWFANKSIKWWSNNYGQFAVGHDVLVKAEQLRHQGKLREAVKEYELAQARFAAGKKYFWEAFTHETLAEVFREMGANTAAELHRQLAHQGYLQYGAPALAKRIETSYGDSLSGQLPLKTNASLKVATQTTTQSTQLDLESVLKASQSISGQMDLDQLASDLLRIALENAGADYGALIAVEGPVVQLKLNCVVAGGTFVMSLQNLLVGDQSPHLLAPMVHLAIRTKKELIANDIERDQSYQESTYVKSTGVKSIICQPVISQNRVVAVLYLENRKLAGAFTAGRIQTLGMLASQGAISMKNAGFVRDIKVSAEKIDRLRSQLEKILAGTKEMAASDSTEEAIGFAFTAMLREIPSFKRISAAVIVRDRSDGRFVYWPLLSDGRFDRATGCSFEQAETWLKFLNVPEAAKPDKQSLAIPVKWGGEPVGLILLKDLPSSELQAEEEQFIATLTQSLGLSLKNIEYQKHLEDLVQARTLALQEALQAVTEKQQKIQAIMDQIEQGILTFTSDLRIESEFSAFLPRLFKTDASAIAGQDVLGLVLEASDLAKDQRSSARAALDAILQEDQLAWMLNNNKMPREIVASVDGAGKILALDWKPIFDHDIVTRMMLTIRDITEHRALERTAAEAKEKHARKLQAVGQMIGIDRAQLADYFEDATSRLNEVANLIANPDFSRMFRHLHTVKGASSILGFRKAATLAHASEDLIKADEATTAFDAEAFRTSLSSLQEEIAYFKSQYHEVFLGANPAPNAAWTLHNLAQVVQTRIGEIVKAGELRFGAVRIVDEIGQWPDEARRALQAVLPHVINNAFDHGYVIPASQGKVLRPIEIDMLAKHGKGAIQVEVRDLGAGLNHEKLRQIAKGRGISEQHYLEVVFADGASTAETVTMTSGRGVGMGAVRQTIREAGGDVKLADGPGGGTVCMITLPFGNVKRLAA